VSEETFQRETIDRLARIETRLAAQEDRDRVLFDKLDSVVSRCGIEADRLAKLETTVNGTEGNPGLTGRTGDLERQVQSLNVKAACIGIAAAVLASLGFNVPVWLK
jgi:hypothetical protein